MQVLKLFAFCMLIIAATTFTPVAAWPVDKQLPPSIDATENEQQNNDPELDEQTWASIKETITKNNKLRFANAIGDAVRQSKLLETTDNGSPINIYGGAEEVTSLSPKNLNGANSWLQSKITVRIETVYDGKSPTMSELSIRRAASSKAADLVSQGSFADGPTVSKQQVLRCYSDLSKWQHSPVKSVCRITIEFEAQQ
jgi:hypothetical protein